KINAPVLPETDVNEFDFTPDSSRVVYKTSLAGQPSELFIVPTAGGTVVKVSGPMVSGGSVASFELTPDGTRVILAADALTDGVLELFSRVISQHWTTSGGSWDSAGNWDGATSPDDAMQVFIDTPAVVTVTAGSTPRTVNE